MCTLIDWLGGPPLDYSRTTFDLAICVLERHKLHLEAALKLVYHLRLDTTSETGSLDRRRESASSESTPRVSSPEQSRQTIADFKGEEIEQSGRNDSNTTDKHKGTAVLHQEDEGALMLSEAVTQFELERAAHRLPALTGVAKGGRRSLTRLSGAGPPETHAARRARSRIGRPASPYRSIERPSHRRDSEIVRREG